VIVKLNVSYSLINYINMSLNHYFDSFNYNYHYDYEYQLQLTVGVTVTSHG